MTELQSLTNWIMETGSVPALLAVLIWVIKNVLNQFNTTIKNAFDSIEKLSREKDEQIKFAMEKHIELSERIIDMNERFFKEEQDLRDYTNRVLTSLHESIQQLKK